MVVDDIGMLALKDARGLFSRDHIQRVSLTETLSRFGRPEPDEFPLSASVLHCLEVFPRLKYLHIRTHHQARFFKLTQAPRAKSFLTREIAKGYAGKDVLSGLLTDGFNGWLVMLGKDLCRACVGRSRLVVHFEYDLKLNCRRCQRVSCQIEK